MDWISLGIGSQITGWFGLDFEAIVIIGFWNRTHFKRVWMTNVWKVLFRYGHNSTYSLKNHLLMILLLIALLVHPGKKEKKKKVVARGVSNPKIVS